MTCPHCGFSLEASHLYICPRCGQALADPADEAADRAGLASDALFESPPLFFTGSLPPGAGRFSEQDGINFLSQSAPPGTLPLSPADGSAPLAPVPTLPRKRKSGLIIGILLALVVVLAGGLGVSLYALSARRQQQTPSGATAPTPTPQGMIAFQDPLTSNGYGWANDSHCFFQNNSYHVKDGFVCFAPAGSFGDANISVQVKQLAGSQFYPYGIALRVNGNTRSWYEFDIISSRQWVFFEIIDGAVSFLTPYTFNTAIKSGLNTINTLLVQAKGTSFTFFVNGTRVGEASDSTFASGLTGLGASVSIEVAYTNFQITEDL
jgi:hypothetical protein